MALDEALKSGLDRWAQGAEARTRERQEALEALEARFERPEYGAGDRVEGRIVVPRAIDCRAVSASLHYAEESCEGLLGGSVKDGPELVHEGSLEAGEEPRFSFQLPERLLPPQACEYGRMFWAIRLDLDRPKRADAVQLEIPVRPDPAWETFTPGKRPETAPAEGDGSEWDVTTAVEPWSVRRGEGFVVRLTIGKPSADRRDMSLRLKCYAAYQGMLPSDGQSTVSVFRRLVWERVYLVDASVPEQTLRFEVPRDVPFAYDGTAVSIQWRVVAKEERNLRKDRLRQTAVQVRP